MGWLEDLQEYVEQYSTAPAFEAMPRLSLEDKGIAGPTGAHRIEEIHTPLNLSYVTFTTGSTAFQNIVGVTAAEISDRMAASSKALALCGIGPGTEILVTYPPLINVFPQQALSDAEISWRFLKASSRDALILALCQWVHDTDAPRVVLGESAFLRATLESAKKMQLLEKLPHALIFITAGTPLDLELLPLAKAIGATVHDLYGCQEFGWLTLDGIPLRGDINLLHAEADTCDLLVGGLATGDRFSFLESGHVCNREGKIITYSRKRTFPELETTVLQTTAASPETLQRLARTILRIKARILRISPNCAFGASHTVLSASSFGGTNNISIAGPDTTRMFDTLLEAQIQYQSRAKTDPAWIKDR